MDSPGRRVWVLAALCLAMASVACLRRDTGPSSAQGRRLYRENGCANCHGLTGHGDGPVGLTLKVRPRDFSNRASFKNGDDVPSIARTLASGLARNGSQMPAFDHLSLEERESLAMFALFLRDGTPTKE